MLGRYLCDFKSSHDVLVDLLNDYVSLHGKLLSDNPYSFTGKASKEDLQDVLSMIRNTSNPQVRSSFVFCSLRVFV